MKIVKQNLQKILTDDQLFKQLANENPWGYILESGKQKLKAMPQSQWNQLFYKGNWSFSIMENKNG